MSSVFPPGLWVGLFLFVFLSDAGYGRELLREETVFSGRDEAVSAGDPGSRHQAYISDRALAVREASRNRFSLASHKTNYVLPLSYGDSRGPERSLDVLPAAWEPLEMEFQFSLQVPIWPGIIGRDSFISFAYTNHSFWQAFTGSAPFREISHEPELIMTWLSNWQLLGFHCVVSQLALSHQSNGRGGEMSRGWNRIYANFVLEREDFFLSFKPWYRIPEKVSDNDNPDLEFYLGNFELEGGYRSGGYGASVLLRNNLRSANRGAAELRLTFPIGQRVRGYFKYFNGYGENLINYDRHQQTFGIGVELAQGF